VTNPFVQFSIASAAAWAPGVETPEAWDAWAKGELEIASTGEPALKAMAPMLRRRAGRLAKMALEAAYRCVADRKDVPMVLCSRHGEVERSVDMLTDLANRQPLSPTSFGLAVHNAVGGLFSIARDDRANHIALAAGPSSIEHGVIEACSLLADGEAAVLLVAYDCPLPPVYSSFQDCAERPFAWSWLIEPATERKIALAWSTAQASSIGPAPPLPGGLQILRFYLSQERRLERLCDGHKWIWSRDV
jgi:hypothetical protein